MPRYEFQEGSSSKFWEIEQVGKSFTTKFGKIGSNGQTKIKDCANEAAAAAEIAKLIAEKTKKGYQLAGGGKAKSKAAAKPNGKSNGKAAATAGQYFEFKEGSSSKFWEITLDGSSHTVRYGKIGTDGQSQKKSFKSAGEARADHDKLVAEKTKKGYALVRGSAPAAPVATHARDPKLEAAIAADPDNADAYLVYADWLQGQGDVRGELIVLQHANKDKEAKKLLAQNKEHFFGKLADAQDLLAAEKYHRLGRPTTWRWGYIEALFLRNQHDRDEEFGGAKEHIDVDEALGWMLDHPSCRFLRELTLGINSFYENGYDGAAKAIGARNLPTLKKLVIGDFVSEETELNWSDAGNMEPLYKAVPNLEHLTLRSGSMKLGNIKLPKLKELFIISGGFDKKSLAAITGQKWPHLETLNVQVGEEGSPEIKLKDLAPIFAGTNFPKVKHLGLGNAPFQDDIAKELAASKIAAQIESLDLSQGTLGDAGAAALAAGKWPKLKSIDVRESWLSKKGIASLKSIAKDVNVGDKYSQQDDEGDPENRYISGRE